jgi:hypothetical protein
MWGMVVAIGVFAGILVSLNLGFRRGSRDTDERAHEGVGAIEAAVFALLGLLLALSFAGGADRLDTRRQFIVQETNAIGTAYLRINLLAPADQPEMRQLFRQYLDARFRVYQQIHDEAAVQREMDAVAGLQGRIWSKAVAASHAGASPDAAKLLLPALNEMIDITTTRAVALRTHLPGLILWLLVVVALLSGLLAGYTMAKRGRRSWLHMVVYAGVVAATVYTVIDLDNPRSGLIRVDAADAELTKLRDSIR